MTEHASVLSPWPAACIRAGPLERSPRTNCGDRVAFRVADAFLPDPKTLTTALLETDELEGTVIGFSDYGQASGIFVLVEVIHKHTVVLPVDKLRLATSGA
jgi:hypothetical protein